MRSKDSLKIDTITNNPVIDLALDTIKIKKQSIIFTGSKRGAEKTAEDIAKHRNQIAISIAPELEELSEQILGILANPTKQCKRLAKCVKKGIAFHHSGLATKQKEIIEDAFKNKIIKIIAATPTLAIGVDMPAYRVIMKDLKRFTHRGMAFIPVLDYMQMTGRAGRPKYDTVGEAITIASNEDIANEIKDKYIYADPEEIYSKLAVEPVLRTYLLSLIATKIITNKDNILKFFEKTFWAYQFQDMGQLAAIIEKTLRQLIEWGFIASNETENEFTAADELGSNSYNATQIGTRVTQLYLDPYTANHLITTIKNKNEKTLNEFSLLQMICHTLEMRPLLSIRSKDVEEVNTALVEFHDNILEKEPNMYDFEYGDFMSSVKTAMFMQNWIDECDEEFLLEKFNITPGEIKVKLDLAEWLLYSTEELCRINKNHKIIKLIRKLRTRLKYGVSEELLPLLKLKGIGRTRARKLFRNKIKDLGDVKTTDNSILAELIGPKITINIKEQLGIKVNKTKIQVKEKKRKGQISLMDF